MAYKIVITAHAEYDLEQAMIGYAQASIAIARHWYESILRHIALLEHYPFSYPVADESAITAHPMRCLRHGSGHGQYRILFEVKGEEVIVLSIRHASRNQGVV